MGKGLSQLNVSDVAIFDSPYNYNGNSIQGIAVSNTQKIMHKENTNMLITFMRDLSQADEDSFLQHEKVIYGEFSAVHENDDKEIESE